MSVWVRGTCAITSALSVDLSEGLRWVYARTRGFFLAWREKRVFFEDGNGERLTVGTSKDSLCGKVKEKGIVVVEFVEGPVLFSSDETKPCVWEREGEGEGERERERSGMEEREI